MTGFVTCAKLTAELAAKQDKLTNCAGAPLTGSVPTCTEMTTAISTEAAAAAAAAIAAMQDVFNNS